MAEKPSIAGSGALSVEYEEALSLCGLVDDVKNPGLLEPRPYRYVEGESISRHGDPVDCLWIIVNGSVAVKQLDQTVFVRRRNEVVGEQHLVSNGYRRIYDLVASESNVEVLIVDKANLKAHPEAGVIWRNIARIISIKLRNASRKTASLGRQLADDTRILHAYTNQYALSRRMEAGGENQTEYRAERSVIWFSDVVDFSRYTLKMPPERIADIVQRFFNAQSVLIVDRGGHIDKFIGDGLMAFWMISGNNAEANSVCCNAVQAAGQAADDVAEITIGNEPLALRIGLHVGLVLSGDFGSATRHQFTLIGTEVNKAARLEQIHSEDVIEGNGMLGGIRISQELRDELSDIERKKFCNRFIVRAKNIGVMEIFTN